MRWLALLAVTAAVAIALHWSSVARRWDLLAYDLTLRVWQRPAPADIIIIGIDDVSLQTLGRWPWSRRTHAELVNRLTQAGPRVIGLDIMFSEPDTVDGKADTLLAQAIKGNGRVVMPVFPERSTAGGSMREVLPLKALVDAAAGLGHVDVEMDEDAVVRSLFLKGGLGSPRWSALPLAMLELSEPGLWEKLPGERRHSGVADNTRQWTRDFHVRVPFAGSPGRFRQISYVDVLHNDDVLSVLRDKVVLVGMTATGLREALPTPVSGNAQPMSGVEFNATVYDGLRAGVTVTPLGRVAATAITLLLLLAAWWAVARASPRRSLVIFAGALVLTLAFSGLMLWYAARWYAPTAALSALLLSYLLWSWHRLKSSSARIRDQDERARATLNSIGDGVIATDTERRITYVNPVAEVLIGQPFASIRGQDVEEILLSADSREIAKVLDAINGCLAEGRSVQCATHAMLNDAQGKTHAIRATASPIHEECGRVTGAVLVLTDITESLAISRRMLHQATHDALTELPNRILLHDRLKHAISNAQRSQTWVGVMFLDLDGFKRVNDSLGHSVGDALLREVAKRLQVSMRTQDTVARWGGDEFVFIIEGFARKEVVSRIANKILHSFSSPFQFDGHELYVTGSIGIGLSPKDGEEAEDLLKKADAAMYRVKERGRNNFGFYSEDINSWTVESLEMEQRLHRAVRGGELELFFQPQVSLATGQINGLEALLRWHHPTEGLISPLRFIPLAEENGLIHKIGDMVIHAACRQARLWSEKGVQPLPISINVSPRQFARRELASTLGKAIAENAIDPALIKVEITESTIVQDIKKTLVALRDFKALGVRVAIDDFGTGFSSLTHLKRFPIDELKIDQSFVRDITSDPDDAAIAQAVIALAHSMNLTVIAEGVETEAQMTFLKVHQCNSMQGFYFSHPRPADEIFGLLPQRAH